MQIEMCCPCCSRRCSPPEPAGAKVLEQMLDNLSDAHAIVRANTSHSPRLVPSGLDLWAEWRDTSAVVTAVRPGFGAEQAGVRAGMQIIAINGLAVR